MSKVYVVTTGWYSDYTIREVFSDEATARKLVDALNAESAYARAEVEEYDVLSAEFQPLRVEFRCTDVSPSGEVSEPYISSKVETRDTFKGRANTTVSEPNRMSRSWRVGTNGPADVVPQAHSDAVAKLRAELMGL